MASNNFLGHVRVSNPPSNTPSNGEFEVGVKANATVVTGKKLLNDSSNNANTAFRPNEAQLKEVVNYIVNNKRRDFLNFSSRFEVPELFAILRAPVKREDLAKGENDEEEDDYWWTSFHLMAYHDRLEMMSIPAVDRLLQRCLTVKSIENCSILWDAFNRLPLSYAVERGHLGSARFLCKCSRGNNTHAINAADIHGMAPLHYAAQFNSRGTAKDLAATLLSQGADPDPVDETGYTPLTYAAVRGNLELVQALVEAGANADHSATDGWTPLILAAYYGHSKVVEYLMKPNPVPPANAQLSTKNGATALIVACQNGHADVVDGILSTSAGVASINAQDNSGRTALHSAAIKGHEQIVGKLLARRANHTITDEWGATALIVAVAGARPERVVPKFLEYGVDIETKDVDGWTPLMISTDKGNIDVTKTLLTASYSYGTSSSVINAQKNDGASPLIIAAAGGYDKLVEELLIPQTQVETSRQVDDWSALFQGTFRQSAKTVRLLINHLSPSMVGVLGSARLREVNKRALFTGMTPLLIASLIGNTAIARVLIEAGANVNSTDKTLFTPLMAAVQSNNEGMVRILVTKGAKVDAQDINGYTALAIAAFFGFPRISEMLLIARANPFITQQNGRTPLQLASERGYSEITRQIFRRYPTAYEDVDLLGRTPLHYAVISCDERTVLALCDNSNTAMNPNAYDKNGLTPLMIAASNPKRKNNDETADEAADRPLLLSVNSHQSQSSATRIHPDVAYIMPILRMKALEIDLRDSNGDTSLMRAYIAQNWPFAEAVLRRGASPTLPRTVHPNFTPLIFAASNGHIQGVKLIKFIAPQTVNVPDVLGRTALFHAAMNNFFEVVDTLLEEPAPANVNMPATGRRNDVPRSDTEGRDDCVAGTTALHFVALYGNSKMARRLVSAGATVDHENENGEHALMLATKACNWDVFEYLLEQGSYLGMKDKLGQTVLHRLCSLESQEEACRGFRLVVKHRGPDVLDEVRDKPMENTALHLAAMHDKPVIVDELIILGASRDVENANGVTPADMIAYGPEIFQSFGNIFEHKWRDMAKNLLKRALRKKYKTNESNPSDVKLIDKMYAEEIRKIDELDTTVERASHMFERYYELDEYHFLDVDTIVDVWEAIKGNKDEKGFISANIARVSDNARGRLLVFNADTPRNLLKVRSSIDRAKDLLSKETTDNNEDPK